MADLPSRKHAIGAELASVRKQLCDAKRKARAEEERTTSFWKLAEPITRVVLIIYVLADCSLEPAVKHLVLVAKRKGWPPRPDDEIGELVHDAFLATSDNDIEAMGDLVAPSNVALTRAAVRIVEEWRVVVWVRRQNARGVAPSSRTLVQRYEERRVMIPAAVRPPSAISRSDPVGEVWAFRLRKRWAGRHGRIRVRETIPLEDMRAKARSTLAQGSVLLAQRSWFHD